MLGLLADHDDKLAFIMDLLGGDRRDDHVLVMRDQRILGAVTDLGPLRDLRHLAAFVGGFLEVFEVIETHAIKRAGDQRQLDLDLAEDISLRRASPLSEGIAVDRDDAVAFGDAPG
jgi:hypothetical protein